MAAFDFSAAQAVAAWPKDNRRPSPIQSLLMQIKADAVCWSEGSFGILVALTDQNDVLAASMSSFHRAEGIGNFLHRNRALDMCAQRALTHEVK